eukprot:CAMPEP_0172440234 /NCGR_PEP_ID=MMETSP1065-20121228/930_1 /TAXON_ID=265537 /ORGANISM="Amphiprora paludosa, Strain CCMP125" /LENGTH=424 /DNA_ID=CAMNT_0013189019 /DNA_START=99 /DNA_END=1373 /DNA_ORIENTATION=-
MGSQEMQLNGVTEGAAAVSNERGALQDDHDMLFEDGSNPWSDDIGFNFNPIDGGYASEGDLQVGSATEDAMLASLMADSEQQQDSGEESALKNTTTYAANSNLTKAYPPRRRRKKRPSTYNGPQRPLSAYNLFFQFYRVQLLRMAGGHVPFATMGKKVGKKWQSLTNEERQVWEDKADIDSNRYRKELKVFKAKAKRKLAQKRLEEQAAALKKRAIHEEQESLAGKNVISIIESSTNSSRRASLVPSYIDSKIESLPAAGLPVLPNLTTNEEEGRKSPPVTYAPAVSPAVSPSPYAPTSFQQQTRAVVTAPTGAREIGNLPEGFPFPDGVPPSGSSVPLHLPDGSVHYHTVHWKVYSVKKSQATAFMDQIKATMAKEPLPAVATHRGEASPPIFPSWIPPKQQAAAPPCPPLLVHQHHHHPSIL